MDDAAGRSGTIILVQEMSARLGVVTGKGLADLIRERTGRPG